MLAFPGPRDARNSYANTWQTCNLSESLKIFPDLHRRHRSHLCGRQTFRLQPNGGRARTSSPELERLRKCGQARTSAVLVFCLSYVAVLSFSLGVCSLLILGPFDIKTFSS